ncbi:MAG: hypothetical protein LBL43_01090 [Treponema sp.]|jgi:hypothetical protein|nr:hypothetical protein [Treponema sp.]
MRKSLPLISIVMFSALIAGCPNESDTVTLTIKNQSFSDLLDVQWQGVTFEENSVENSILTGHSVTRGVSSGSGYIFFKRKSNPAFARTKEVVTLGESGAEEFVFIDNTLIVEANNPDNTGTLKDMITTVAFYDDAEGEILPYAERINAMYYNDGNSYKGDNLIALGSSARLKLILELDRKAELSFWFKNSSGGSGALSIDGTQKAEWPGSYNWSYQKYPLEAGVCEIVWTSTNLLSLDNILVVYTE